MRASSRIAVSRTPKEEKAMLRASDSAQAGNP